MLSLSIKKHFNAAHKLYNLNWSKEKNKQIYGVCANENGHGHNFELIVTVKGEADPKTGFVIDLKKMSDLLQKEIIETVDYKNLNMDVPFMKNKIASCENLVIEFWNILESKIRELSENAKLHKIRLVETPRNFVDYFGD